MEDYIVQAARVFIGFDLPADSFREAPYSAFLESPAVKALLVSISPPHIKALAVGTTISLEPKELGFVVVKKDAASFRVGPESPPLHSQLMCMSLAEEEPLRTLHAYLDTAFEPLFSNRQATKSVLVHMDQLKKALEQCTAVVAIPEVKLIKHVHPLILKSLESNSPIDESLLQDQSFLTALEKSVMQWILDIKLVTVDSKVPDTSSLEVYVTYWLEMDRVLDDIDKQLKSPPVVMTQDVLRSAKRVKTLTQLTQDTMLESSRQRALAHHSAVKTFPITAISTASDLKELQDAIQSVFRHMKSSRLACSLKEVYDHSVVMLRGICTQTADALRRIGSTHSLLSMPWESFAPFFRSVDQVVDSFTRSVDEFVVWINDSLKRKNFPNLLVSSSFVRTVSSVHHRLTDVYTFRFEFQQLRSYDAEVEAIFQDAQKTMVDPLGMRDSDWSDLMKAFENRLDVVETRIVDVLRSRLADAATPHQMYLLWSSFSSLMHRPQIAEAVSEFRNFWIEKVASDLRLLQEKFKKGYDSSDASKLGRALNLTPVSGAVSWARQMERQVIVQITRVEEMFGRGVEQLSALRSGRLAWELNTELSEFVGVPFRTLAESVYKLPGMPSDSNIAGTAVATAFCQLIYSDQAPAKKLLEDGIEWLRQHAPAGIVGADLVALVKKNILEVRGVGHSHAAVKRFRLEADAFKDKIKQSIRDLIRSWTERTEAWIAACPCLASATKTCVLSGPIFEILDVKSVKGTKRVSELLFQVNFPPTLFEIIREKEQFRWLGVSEYVSEGVKGAVLAALECQQNAVILIEAVETVRRSIEKVSKDFQPIECLVARDLVQIYSRIEKGLKLTWEGNATLEPFCMGLSTAARNLERKVDDLVVRHLKITELIETCRVSKVGDVAGHVAQVQDIVDSVAIHNEQYANIRKWVEYVNGQVSDVVASKIDGALRALVTAISMAPPDRDSMPTPNTADASSRSLFDSMEVSPFVTNLKLVGGIIVLDPPVEAVRMHWFTLFDSALSQLCNIPAIHVRRFDTALAASYHDQLKTYRHLLSSVSDRLLLTMYEGIESMVRAVASYTSTWMRYQALWSVDAETIVSKLGSDLQKWLALLDSVKEARDLVDAENTAKSYGSTVVECRAIQVKVASKYDDWIRRFLLAFRTKLQEESARLLSEITRARDQLEAMDIETSTRDAVVFVTVLQNMKKQIPSWMQAVESFRKGQKVLERQRVSLPADWIHVDYIDGIWNVLNQLLQRKSESMSSMMDELERRVREDDRALQSRIASFTEDWSTQKPVRGDLDHDEALKVLQSFDVQAQRLFDDFTKISAAKSVIDPNFSVVVESDNPLRSVVEDIKSLHKVWSECAGLWSRIDELRDTAFTAVVPRKVRTSIEELISAARALPSWMQSYAAVDYITDTLDSYKKSYPLIVDLRADSMRERHWKTLLKRLKAESVSLNGLTLGSVFKLEPHKHEHVFKEVLRGAQGEFALEVFLGKVSQFWSDFVLDLVVYRNRCALIRGWEDMFSKITEHTNSLVAMRSSPFYAPFKEEAERWEDRLNRLRVLVDIWADVQRRWVYLEGIFGGVSSADIRAQLPNESSRFTAVDGEFVRIMRKVQSDPRLLEIFNSQKDLSRVMERIGDSLSKIQRSLGEYLEKQRSAFPRFYFIGDEDLLEMLAQAADPLRIAKHLRKMFAGINSFVLSDGNVIQGVASREGEELKFISPIPVNAKDAVHVWLSAVESAVRAALLRSVRVAAQSLFAILQSSTGDDLQRGYMKWFDDHPAQAVLLAMQVWWTTEVERALSQQTADPSSLSKVATLIEQCIVFLTHENIHNSEPLRQRKSVSLITELVHQRDACRTLIGHRVSSPLSFDWLCYLRYYLSQPVNGAVEGDLIVRCANAEFVYGLEYLGVEERLVQTPLTDRAFLTLTQALHARLGGSPFGPAGTGKTETVKALGQALGRFTLVFNCDDTFDVRSMGRIFLGLCHCGAWGCFDEFNRLEEKILSAVSQQIQTIQIAIRTGPDAGKIDLIGRSVSVNPSTGIFVTMNPGYAGRRNLPDNLKQLFRSFAMIQPDKELIAEVMLYSQGFQAAESLARKIVPFFALCADQLSRQAHYDFGLRALKSVLITAGNLKRAVVASGSVDKDITVAEYQLMVRALSENLIPKLVPEDVPLLRSLLSGTFPGVSVATIALPNFFESLSSYVMQNNLVSSDAWMEKAVQVLQISQVQHGIMLVGPAGCGKTELWQAVLYASARAQNRESKFYVIDPKAITKDELYGVLDPTTREWTDGTFTQILRRIVDGNAHNDASYMHWIVFDGDVDPEWVENLNSVLDDNKLLTLPNGERISLPPNVRLVFEVEDLGKATLATVSRCGMIWLADSILTMDMQCTKFGTDLEKEAVKDEYGVIAALSQLVRAHCSSEGLLGRAITWAGGPNVKGRHIMDFTVARALHSVFTLLRASAHRMIDWARDTSMLPPLDVHHVQRYVIRQFMLALVWGLGGSLPLTLRSELSRHIASIAGSLQTDLPQNGEFLHFGVAVETGNWVPWSSLVPQTEVESARVAAPDVVIPTVDTLRHEDVVRAWMLSRCPVILCGPPGSGKTMTLTAVLQNIPDAQVITLSFSSATSPQILFKTLERYCELERTPTGLVCRPSQPGKWLVLFCDEINLPAPDAYGTQRIITLLRQLVEKGGYWRADSAGNHVWVRLERIQIVGACNPPTDPGRHPLSHRFLRHTPVLLVDFPGEESLLRVYGCFMRAALRLIPHLSILASASTAFMVDVYSQSQMRFTPDLQPHYIYSPRELSRWMRSVFEVVRSTQDNNFAPETFVRLLVHEGLRLFHDRLVLSAERDWTVNLFDTLAHKHFGAHRQSVDVSVALQRPMLFSNWLSRSYVPVDARDLKEYIQARLRSFADEEMDVQLVVFDEVLDHVLRIDRVLRQPLGHLLLAGASGAGKTVLTRFVAWLNGLSVFQIKAHRNYTLQDFEQDLRSVLKRAGVKGEKICFIFDESNILDSAFLEYMNALLASGEVPGLFEGDEFLALINSCRESSRSGDERIDAEDELFKWFLSRVQRNLHVVMTMNPANPDFSNRTATSPALFNRCVVDWFGDWNETAMFQVASEFTAKVDISDELAAATESGLMSDFTSHVSKSGAKSSEDAFLNLLSQSMVDVHKAVSDIAAMLLRKQGVSYYLTPRHFLDFIKHFLSLHAEKTAQIVDQQLHLNRGLDKLVQTEKEVAELKGSLREYEERLAVKSQAANEKLQQMMKEQREAEESKKASEEMSVIVDKQTLEVVSRREAATKELSTVEPLVAEAKDAVKEIKKKQLDELRALPNPPAAVQFCLQAVCTMLGKEKIAVDWEGIRKIIRDAEFIPSIVEFDTSQIDEKLRKKMDKFTSNELFEFETVNRGSKACGPLVKWVRAQLSYSSVLDRVAPLRAELSNLESQLDDLQQKQGVLNASIKTLEESINKYKEEYASLIAEAEHIKAEKQQVQVKTDRSTALLVSLSQERQRWESQTKGFARDLSTLVGDSLLAAAFMTYAGFFDEHYRQAFLMPKWAAALEKRFLPTRSSLSLVEMLSTPAQRLVWQSAGLPDDEVAVENAVMLQRFNRYPLVIDPSGQGLRFLMKSRSASAPGAGSSAVVKLSFLDGAFMASLEDAVRCGTTLIVEDVEHLDPVLNPVLNREVQKTGGRQLVRIGNREVDLSPSFNLFLVTRDPGARFSPDLSSRVTFVNFSLTPGSLVNQSLATVLRAERPEMEERRSGVLKAQGEFRVKLRQLEESLLSALAESSGNLLENDAVLRQLERIKQDATEVQLRVQETDSLMAEINQTSVVYNTFASAASKLFFAIQRLAEISPLYQFSLDSFNKIVRSVLDMPLSDDGPRGSTTRLSQLVRSLFRACFDRVRPSVLYDDALALAVRFAQIFCAECAASDSISDDAIDVLLRGSAAGVGKMVTSPKSPSQMGIRVRDALPDNVRDQISSSQLELLETVLSLPLFAQMAQSVVSHDEKVLDFLQQLLSADAAETVSMSASASVDEIRSAFSSLLLLKALRPDRLVFGAMRFISAVFGSEFLEATQIDVSSSLASAVQKGDPLSPLMLVSAPGYDPSGQIDDLASVSKKTDIVYVALGSSESLEAADRAVAGAIRAGQWVVLKNVHLALSWLETLEKRLHALDSSSSSSLGAVASRGPTSTTRVHENFRLFLTSEVHPGLPSSLLTRSFVLFFEPQAGVRAAVLQAYATAISPERSDRVPVERSRLHFLIAWLHAVIVGRLRYVPLGWTKAYEFNESDLRIALDVVDAWVDTVAKGRVNVRPDELPWGALRQLLIRSVYGGRMETSVDMKILDSLVSQYICIEAFREDYALVSGETPVSLPLQFTRRSQIMSWLHNLSATETPTWLGLHASAQTMLRANQGRVLISKLVLLQSLYEEEAAYDQVESDKKVKEEQVVALGGAQLLKAAQAWLSLLPPTSISQPTSSSALPDPLRRFFAREALVAQQTVTTVRSDLDLLSQALRGEVKLSNLVRALHKDLTADVIPGRWRLFRIPPGVGAASFVRSLKARCDQLQSLISASGQAAAELHLSLGSLFFPHAFLTAVQQSVAAAYATSLEAVRLRFVVQVKGSTPFESRLPCTFVIDGLEVQGGGVWDDSGYDSLRDTSGRSALPSATLQWTLSTEAADSDFKQGLEMPIYTDSSRTDLLYSIVLPSVGKSSSESRSGFAQRAAAVVASSMM